MEEEKLKDIIVELAGNKFQPPNNEVTIDHIVEFVAEEFPELVIRIAEENWINGYTQALEDTEYIKNKPKEVEL